MMLVVAVVDGESLGGEPPEDEPLEDEPPEDDPPEDELPEDVITSGARRVIGGNGPVPPSKSRLEGRPIETS